MKKQQMVIALYRDLAKDASEMESYERSTCLGNPDDIKQDGEEEDAFMQAMEDRVDQEEITEQFFNQTVLDNESKAYRKSIKMKIRSDIKRLYQLYLDSNVKFQLSMPSQNIPIRLYVKNEPQTEDTITDRSSSVVSYSNSMLSQSSIVE